jgi:hypothetical protein
VDIVEVSFKICGICIKPFMNMKNYEQIEMNGDLVGDDAKYLRAQVIVVQKRARFLSRS